LKQVSRARELRRAELAEARKDTVLDILEAIVIALVLALTIRTFVVQAFKIPSGSMIPTLRIGDHILVNKFLYGSRLPFVKDRLLPIRHPRRGDVLVFKFPKDHREDYIKRLVGQPGDVVEMAERRVYVNGKPWEDDPGRYGGGGRPAWAVVGDSIRFGPIYVPRKGDTLQIVKGQLRINGRVFNLPQARIADMGILKDYFSIFYSDFFPPGTVMDVNTTTPVVRVNEDRYFMMGDNRDNSRDSRFWGFVRDSEIRGEAFVIYWSWNREDHWVRWGRFGELVR
jgi:signal peptidase I